MIDDVSERKAAEEQLRQAQKMEAVGQLTAGIAHDFNNLLMGLLGYAELARRDLEERGATSTLEFVKRIEEAGTRAAALTTQLLAFGRRQTLAPTTVNLDRLVGDTIALLRRIVDERIEIVCRLDPQAPPVKADMNRIEQVLFNLVLNARDAMPSGGTITIETRAAGDGVVVISVADTGVGMTPEVRERIFEPFFTTKPVGQGTGLGLATVWGIVTQSGGRIDVESEAGRGSTFSVSLPVDAAAAAPAAEPPAAEPARGAQHSILVVEDEDVVRDVVATMLRESGYAVTEAAGPREGLELARETAFHALLTDLVMPEMSGVDLAAAVREERPDVRVLYMSGYPANNEVDASSLIQKPFAGAELLARLEALLAA